MPICHICRKEEARLSFEHVPPRSAFNSAKTVAYGMREWLKRDEQGTLRGGRQQQKGAGVRTLCVSCNNLTGAWYVGEIAIAARTGVQLLAKMDVAGHDRSLDYFGLEVKFIHSSAGPHPLRLIKQIVTMMLATCPPELGSIHPELAAYVLDRYRKDLPERFRVYISLYAGPNARTSGVAGILDGETGAQVILAEVAWPPFAYVMTIDSPEDSVRGADITRLSDFDYDTVADIEIVLPLGFGHTPYPADYRSEAMIERDRERRGQEPQV
jgi:hypothetical protein